MMNPVQRTPNAAADQPGRLRVGVVGVGRVGAVLGAALARAGHTVVAGTGTSRRSRQRADRLLPGVPLMSADAVVARADLVLLAVPDDVLPGLVDGLAATQTWRMGQFVAHVSGGYGISVLSPAARRGALVMALHPAMTFPDRPEDLERLSGTCFGVTAPAELRTAAEALVVEMGAEPVWIAEEARPLYHAALVSSANHLITLIAESLDLLRQADVAVPERVLGPLVSAALDNSLRLGDAALTGPVSRGDAAMVARHVDALASHAPDSVPAYLAMARRTADRAFARGRLNAEQLAGLLDVLAERSLGDSL